MAKGKDWEDMTADEKADYLRLEIHSILKQLNKKLSQYGHRISAMEEALKPKAGR